MNYHDLIAGKLVRVPETGFDAQIDNPNLFAWQREIVRTACRIGRFALFEDTGLGKSRQALAWADAVARKTGGRVLLLTPLAVGPQFVREAELAGIDGVAIARDQGDVRGPISIANYERLHKFDAASFAGVVLDESSILKAYSGTTKKLILSTFARTPYRLACTATPAPNDHLELGNHAEFLSVMSSHQMIARWFITSYDDDASSAGNRYRLKGHAVESFWDWVASWSRLIGLPSDLAPHYSDDGYVLPPLSQHWHSVKVDLTTGRNDGALFREVEGSATKLHKERRFTAAARAEKCAEIVAQKPGEPWTIWVETDYDADEVRKRIPEVCEVKGSDKPDEKEARLLAFSRGDERIMMTKPSIAGFGLNWQHCANMAMPGPSFSYEQDYQAIRRSWRFGQTRPVHVHRITAATEQFVVAVHQRKAADHVVMKDAMYAASRRAQGQRRDPDAYHPTHWARLPAWLRSQS